MRHPGSPLVPHYGTYDVCVCAVLKKILHKLVRVFDGRWGALPESEKGLSYKGAGRFILLDGFGADIAIVQARRCMLVVHSYGPVPIAILDLALLYQKMKMSGSEEENDLNERDGNHRLNHHHGHHRGKSSPPPQAPSRRW